MTQEVDPLAVAQTTDSDMAQNITNLAKEVS